MKQILETYSKCRRKTLKIKMAGMDDPLTWMTHFQRWCFPSCRPKHLQQTQTPFRYQKTCRQMHSSLVGILSTSPPSSTTSLTQTVPYSETAMDLFGPTKPTGGGGPLGPNPTSQEIEAEGWLIRGLIRNRMGLVPTMLPGCWPPPSLSSPCSQVSL